MAEKRPLDHEEETKVNSFIETSCGCRVGPGGSSCSNLFTKDEILEVRSSMQELERGERDMVLLGFIMSARPRRRTDNNTIFCLYSERVCRSTFLFLLDLSKKLFTTLTSHFDKFGIASRRHGNINRLPQNTLSEEANEQIKRFIENFAEVHGVCLPGRDPSHRDERNLLIPSFESKTSIYSYYKESCARANIVSASYSLFCDRWIKLFPHIKVAKPMTDLCWICQKSNNIILRSQNKSDAEKSAVLREQLQHLRLASQGTQYYRAQCEHAKLESLTLTDAFEKHLPCSFDGEAHYSWDYAQQLHYPHDPFQPGPIYFKTPRKCAIFGVCNDGTNIQYNYLIDEINNTGKGANSTISYVHHCLSKYGMGEKKVHFHADNCSGKTTLLILYHLENDFITNNKIN